jgi:type I restriction enzyme S subunit
MMFYKEVNFKETSIGRIPEDWEVIRFQEVADIRSNRSKLEVTDKVAFIPMELIPDDGIYADFEIRDFNKVSSYTYCEAGDILLAKITPSLENGKQGIVPSNIPKGFALATTEVFPIVCRNVERMFLFYLLKYPKFRKILESSMRATTGRLRVPKEALLNLKIPLPKFDEQQKIAEILSTVDEAVQKINEIIAKTERLKRGLMQELLTKGIGHKEFKDTEIGRIPKDWRIVELGETVEINKESIDPIKEIPNKTFIYIDIDSIESGTGKIRNPKRILGRDAPSRARRVIHENDVIMSTVRPYLKAFAIVPKEYDNQICSTGFAVLTCKNLILPYFLLSVLFSDSVIAQCNRMMVGGQYPALNQSQVSRIKIPLPPLLEQQRITEILSAIDQKLEIERKEKTKLERIKQGLMDLLLTGKIRVKVVDNV